MNYKNIISKLHLWLGLSSGLVVFIVALTGCILVFQDDLRDVFYKDWRFIAEENKAESEVLPSVLFKNVREVLPRQELKTLYFLQSKDPNRSLLFWAYDPAIENYYGIYVNQYTGEVIKHFEWKNNFKDDFFGRIDDLHTTLWMGKIGRDIIGVSTIIFVILLISGLILWWPKNKKSTGQRLWFKWKGTTKWKRKNYDLHNILGFYSLIFALLIALTGLVMAYNWMRDTVYYVASGEAPKTEHTDFSVMLGAYNQMEAMQTLDLIYPKFRFENPEIEHFTVPEPTLETNPVEIVASDKNYVRSDEFHFHPLTGELVEIEQFKDKNLGEKILRLNYPIHSGLILGLPGKILAFFASLIVASLPITGFYIWWGRRKKKKGKDSKKQNFSQKINGKTKKSGNIDNGLIKESREIISEQDRNPNK